MVLAKPAEITGYPKGDSTAEVPVGACLAAGYTGIAYI
jgi:hypothetical protein